MPNVVQKAGINRRAVSDRQAAALTSAAAGPRSESCPVPLVCVGLAWHSLTAACSEEGRLQGPCQPHVLGNSCWRSTLALHRPWEAKQQPK